MQMVMRVRREELAERREEPIVLTYDRNSEPEVIEEKRKEYLNQNKDTFSDLVKQIRNRKKVHEKNVAEAIDSEPEKEKSEASIVALSEPIAPKRHVEPEKEKSEASIAAQSDPIAPKRHIEPEKEKSESSMVTQKSDSIAPKRHIEPEKEKSEASIVAQSDPIAPKRHIEPEKEKSSPGKSEAEAANNDVISEEEPKKCQSSSAETSSEDILQDTPAKKGKKNFFRQNENVLTSIKAKNTPSPSSSGVGQIYVTPNKAKVDRMLKSQRTQGQIESAFAKSPMKPAKVPCPVCGVRMTQSFMNVHLDRCLQGENQVKKRRKRGIHEEDEDFVASDSENQSQTIGRRRTRTRRALKVSKADETLDISQMVEAIIEEDEEN